MSASEQSISLGGLLGAGESAVAGSGPGLRKSDNGMKNKEFSSVLGAEQERMETPATAVRGATPEGKTQPVTDAGEAIVPVDDAEIGLFFSYQNGNALPLDGQLLPLSGESGESPDTFPGLSLSLSSDAPVETDGQENVLAALAGQDLPIEQLPVSGDGEGESAAIAGESDGAQVLPAMMMPLNKDGKPLTETTTVAQPSRPVDIQLTPATTINVQAPSAQGGAANTQGVSPELTTASGATVVEMAHRAGAADQAFNQPTNGGQTPGLANPNLMAALVPAQAGERLSKPGLASTAGIDTGTASAATNSYASGVGMNAADTSRTPLPVTQAAPIPVEVGKQGWGEQVMQRVMWMSAQNIQRAEIALDPPELGPLQVRVSAQGEHMTVSFTSSHGVVRDALDQGLPRLRDLMEQQGLDLVDVDVSDQNLQQRQAHGGDAESQQESGDNLHASETAADSATAGSTAGEQLSTGSTLAMGLVDHYV